MGELFLALVAGLGSTILLARVRSWWSSCVVIGVAAAMWACCAFLLSTTGLLFSPLPATAALACPFPIVILLNYLIEKRTAERARQELVSAEEHTREMMRESEARYQKLVENINDAIIVDDIDGRLVFANRRFRDWFGLEGRDIREIVLEDYVAPEWRAALRDQHNRRMSGAAVPGNCEYEGLGPGGRRIWIEALVTNLEEDGRIVGTQAALRDVTERKRIEAQYLQAQKMEGIGRMAGSVAHDFNNLLTVINGYSDMLLKRRLDENQVRADLQAIRAAGERAAELTRNLLAFSRKQLVQLRVLNPNTIVAEAEKMYGRLIGEDIELITHLSPELGNVMADSGQLHQILMNLLVNARDAMPRGGVIVIETRNVEAGEDFLRLHPGFAPGFYICLAVTDTGTGITDDVKRHLFEPFFTTKDMGKGTGLGLATVHGIVRQNGGQIEVASKPGEGATFHIYLPRVQTGEPAQPGVHDMAAVWKGSETVLVVEDQDAVRQYIRTVLEHCGHRVLHAANGPDALALAEQFPDTIHLLVTDVVLPLMNGSELAEKLKLSRPQMKVLFTSGYSEETIGARGIISSDLAYLPKPFTPEALLVKVREALAPPESTHHTMGSTGA
jgi:PAS domain S-box-containing protein